MRLFFNHGLSASEIFTNVPKRVTDKNWRWFITRYGHTACFGEALADPFKYSFALAFHKILTEKIRFRVPYASSYIDFEIVTGEKFEQHCQNGRFQNIDFISSDFTGYALNYFYTNNHYQKTLPIFVGSELKKNFIDRINDGEKFYTIKDFGINDVLPQIYEKFPELSKREVRDLVLLGWRRMDKAIRYGCCVTIQTTKFLNCYVHIGKITKGDEQVEWYRKRMIKKIRRINFWNKTRFKGYYYFTLSEGKFKEFVETNINNINTARINFQVMLHLFPEEVIYMNTKSYLFKIKMPKYIGVTNLMEKIKSRDIQYVGECINYKIISDNKTWQEKIKEYAKGINQ